MNKIKNFILLCVLLVMTCGIVPSTEAGVRWSLDFEDGFNASSGTLNVVQGNPAAPYDANEQVYILYDANSNSNVVRVKKSWHSPPSAKLYYTDLDPSILGPSGRVTLDFKLTEDLLVSHNAVCFFNSTDLCETADAGNLWAIGLAKGTATLTHLFSRTYCTPMSGRYATGAAGGQVDHYVPLLTKGWHTMEFEWYRTEDNDPERDKADVRMKIDGQVFYSFKDLWWTWPNTTVCIGHYWDGGYVAPKYYAGTADVNDNPIYLDNIFIYDDVPNECGAPGAMEYMDEDADENCHVDIGDIRVLSEQWLQCTDPNDSACDEYWL